MKFSVPFFQKKENRYIVVVSGGGVRGFYGGGIFKALEEYGYKEKTDAIFGVSAGALLASYRSAGYSADTILDLFLNSDFFSLEKDINFMPKHSIFKNTILKKQFERELPKDFNELKIPTFVGCTDTTNGQSKIISSGDLTSALLGTIAIPGIFPAIERNGSKLIDGGVTNNFPVDIAKRMYPEHKIIAISLNMYRKNPKITNIFESLMVAFEIMLRKDIEDQGALADIFFCKNLNTSVFEFNKTKFKNLYKSGYEDGIEKLKQLN